MTVKNAHRQNSWCEEEGKAFPYWLTHRQKEPGAKPEGRPRRNRERYPMGCGHPILSKRQALQGDARRNRKSQTRCNPIARTADSFERYIHEPPLS